MFLCDLRAIVQSQGLRRIRPIAACAIWGTRGKPLLFHSNEYTRGTISCATDVVVSLTDRATVVKVDSVVFETLTDEQMRIWARSSEAGIKNTMFESWRSSIEFGCTIAVLGLKK